MGYFTIDLPADRKGEVRFGKIVRKAGNFFDLFRRKTRDREVRTGYIVKVHLDAGDEKIYHLLKSKEDEWLTDGSAGFQVAEDDEISLAIKKAIDEHEHQKAK